MEKSEAWFKKSLEIAPRDLETIQTYAYMLINFRQCDRAQELLNQAKKISVKMTSALKEPQMWGTDELTMKLQAMLFASQGERGKALALLPRYATVDGYCRLGMKEEALAKLKKDISGDTPTFHRWSYLILVNSNFLEVLRADSRFQEIVNQAKAIYDEVMAKYGSAN
jgi:tetratricopeptide (TPR) repeat protein